MLTWNHCTGTSNVVTSYFWSTISGKMTDIAIFLCVHWRWREGRENQILRNTECLSKHRNCFTRILADCLYYMVKPTRTKILAKKIDTKANVSILCGNCTRMVTFLLSITTHIGLPAKFDTLAIVSNFFARILTEQHAFLYFKGNVQGGLILSILAAYVPGNLKLHILKWAVQRKYFWYVVLTGTFLENSQGSTLSISNIHIEWSWIITAAWKISSCSSMDLQEGYYKERNARPF